MSREEMGSARIEVLKGSAPRQLEANQREIWELGDLVLVLEELWTPEEASK